jgi:serine protease Do
MKLTLSVSFCSALLLFVSGCEKAAVLPLPPPTESKPVVIERPVINFAEASSSDIMRAVNTAMADTVEKVLPSVVVIRTEATQYIVDWYGRLRSEAKQPVGQGSGVIIDARGYVITNNHVLQGGQSIEVILNDQTTYEAELVGRNEQTDIAVLKIKTDDDIEFPAITIGDSDAIRVGEMVMAIGSPFSLSSTVTHGLVSQKGRAEENLPIIDFIQTSAPINPGNSGGALIDMDGNLIGINTMIRTGGPASRGSIGIGFAIPSDQAMRAAKLIMDGTSPEELPWLGVMMQNTRFGVLFSRIIPNSPAEESGLMAGDLLLSVNGRAIRSGQDLSSLVRLSDPGERLMLEILRGRKQIALTVTTRLMDASELIPR